MRCGVASLKHTLYVQSLPIQRHRQYSLTQLTISWQLNWQGILHSCTHLPEVRP